LDTIIAREVADGAPGALIFAHHLTDLEESGRGPVTIPEVQLEELKEHRISYYTCHAPLDCHLEISTARALANALGLHEQEHFAPHYGGMSAVHGVVGKPTSYQAFAARLAKITDVDRLRYDQVRHCGLPVNRVAVVPGGGGRPERLEEAAAAGCDTYVTGQWWPFSETNEAAEPHREQMRQLLPQVRMNLLGASHYATEMVVMRDQMPGWFRDRGVDAEFVPQEDPWR
jgi:putative NIF3 family GTP cyclohydrolase 1 type 2